MTPYSVVQNAEKEPDQTEKDLHCETQILRTPSYDSPKNVCDPVAKAR